MPRRRLTDLADPDAEPAHQLYALYAASFPADERDPLEEIRNVIRERARAGAAHGRVRHCSAAFEDGEFAGLAVYGYYRAQRLGVLAYLATMPAVRGRGLGGWILGEIAGRLAGDAAALDGAPPLGLCWEVERVEDGAGAAEQALRRRRIEFYRRQGAVLLDELPFVAPPLGPGLPAVAYHLMFLPPPGVEQPVRLQAGLMRAVVDAVLLGSYGQREDSPYYRAALAALAVLNRSGARS